MTQRFFSVLLSLIFSTTCLPLFAQEEAGNSGEALKKEAEKMAKEMPKSLSESSEASDQPPTTLPPKIDPPTSANPSKNAATPSSKEGNSDSDAPSVLGIVQWVSNGVAWENEKRVGKPVYRSVLLPKDGIKLIDEKAIVKIVTDSLCTGVAYGPGRIQTPEKSGAPWIVETQSVRWICQGNEKDLLLVNGQSINMKLEGAEIFINKDDLLVRRDQVTYGANPLNQDRMYQYSRNASEWKPNESNPSKYQRWKFNQKTLAPIESFKEAMPVIRFDQRLILAFEMGGTSLNHDTDEFDAENGEVQAFRLEYQRKFWGNKAFTVALSTMEYDENEDGESGQGFARTDYDSINVDLGIRWDHESWWSFYTRVGYANATLETTGNIFDSGSNTITPFDFKTKYGFAYVDLGIDATLFRDKVSYWEFMNLEGLYVGMRVRVMQSVSAKNDFANPPFPVPGFDLDTGKTEGSIFGADVIFTIGLPFGL